MSTTTEPTAPPPAPEPAPVSPGVMAAAAVSHEANRGYCAAIGDTSQLPWAEAPDWQRASAINGVLFHLANPHAGPSASHDNWMREKAEDGWTYGPVKDAEAKQHPCMVPFDELPPEQQAKDRLFRAVIHALAGPKTPEEVRIEKLEAQLAQATELLRSSLGLFRTYQLHHLAKLNHEKATRNGDQANAIDRFLVGGAV